MTKTTNDYIITGGVEGKNRLNTLSDVLYPYTRALLERNGVKAGVSFLDAGCGGGNVARMVSGITGDSGKVTAVDFDKGIIALNKQEAQENTITNIDYRAMSAYDLAFDNEYDVAYARFLLSHLAEPVKVVEKMLQSVRPGGRVVAEDVHFSGHFCYPQNDAFDKYIRLYTEAAKLRGHDPEIGPSLPSLFEKAGVADVGFDVIQPCFNKGAGKWMAYITLDKIKDALVALGLASAAEIQTMLSELEIFTNDESTIISLPRIVRVWGKK